MSQPPAVAYSFPPNPNQSQIYLRFKRHNQTLFVPCESTQVLQSLKERVAELVGRDEFDVRFFSHLTEEKRTALINQILEKQRELAKSAKKSHKNPQEIKLDTPETVQIPPLDCSKKLWELGLDNDQIVFFVFRTSEFDDTWEPICVPGVFVDQRGLRSAGGENSTVQPTTNTNTNNAAANNQSAEAANSPGQPIDSQPMNTNS